MKTTPLYFLIALANIMDDDSLYWFSLQYYIITIYELLKNMVNKTIGK